MKLTHAAIAGLIAISLTAFTTGCGERGTIVVPDAAASSAPTGQGSVVVSVIDNTSKPVAGATVKLTDAKGADVLPGQDSGPDGKTTFAKVPFGTGYAVSATNAGVTGSQSSLGVDGEAPVLVTIMLVPANGALGSVTGAIRDGLSGQAIDGATVSILGTQQTVTTGADGAFVLKDVPAGSPTLVAIAKGYREARTNLALKGGKLEKAELKLFPSGNAARLGHTLVSSRAGLLEFDRYMNKVAGFKRAAYQGRALENGNTLIADGVEAAEINASGNTVWNYHPLIGHGTPQGVAKGANGHVYVADPANNRVLEVTPGRNVERTIRGGLNKPMGVDRVDSAHTTLVADTGSNRVVEISDAGAVVWSVGDGTPNVLNHPTFATRLPNGNTLITDTGNSRVMEVNKAQKLVWIFGGDGNKATCWLPNSAVRLGNGNTLIADTGNNRVIEVNAKGAVVFTLPNLEQPLFAERL